MTICGIVPPHKGRVLFNRLPINRIVGLGINQVPEGRRIFPHLTVLENLDMGAFLRKDRTGIKRDMAYIFEIFPVLTRRRHPVGRGNSRCWPSRAP